MGQRARFLGPAHGIGLIQRWHSVTDGVADGQGNALIRGALAGKPSPFLRKWAISLLLFAWSYALALTTLKSLKAEIKQLEAQKKLVEKRDGEVPKALAVLQRYAKVLTPAQRRQVAKIIGETVEIPARRAAATPKGPLKGRKLGSVAPKYRLPTGETWTGRGLSPKVFTAWAKSAEGQSWTKAHPGSKFPSADGLVKSARTPAEKAAKAAKKVVKKPAKRASTERAAKKATRVSVKKPAK